MKSKKLENLEKKFGIVTDLVEELSEGMEEFDPIETLPDIIKPGELIPVDEQKVFEIETLKTDFLMVRNNIIKLINTGQRLLNSASLLDVSELKASQLQSITELLSTIVMSSKTLVDLYKQITEIENLRSSKKGSKFDQQSTSSVNMGTVQNTNNIIFSGDTSQLLDFLKENKNV